MAPSQPTPIRVPPEGLRATAKRSCQHKLAEGFNKQVARIGEAGCPEGVVLDVAKKFLKDLKRGAGTKKKDL